MALLKVQDENSRNRQETAALLPKQSKEDFLSLLGNTDDKKYPIFMTGTQLTWPLLLLLLFGWVINSVIVTNVRSFSGPTLYTLCTALFDLDARTLLITEGNPKEGKVAHTFHL